MVRRASFPSILAKSISSSQVIWMSAIYGWDSCSVAVNSVTPRAGASEMKNRNCASDRTFANTVQQQM